MNEKQLTEKPCDMSASYLATNMEHESKKKQPCPLNPWTAELEKTIKKAYEFFEEASRKKKTVPQAAEWLLDNYYIIEEAFAQFKENIPLSFYKKLPIAKVQESPCLPRIYFLSAGILLTNQGRLDIEGIKTYVNEFQKTIPLTIGELWAIPTMMRFKILEGLASSLSILIDKKYESKNVFPFSFENAEKEIAFLEAADYVSVFILSLRMIANQDWKVFFEDCSLVEKKLRKDPAGFYDKMDFATRNSYRNEIEELGKGSALAEIEAVEKCLELVEKGSDFQERTVGYYLIDLGREELEKELAYKPAAKKKLKHWLKKRASAFFLLTNFFGSLFLSASLAFICWLFGAKIAEVFFAFFLSLVPLSAFVSVVVNRFVLRRVSPKILPKLNLSEGVPEEFLSIVVIPTLVGSEADVEMLLRKIETQYLGNIDRNIYFALLTDFTDAKSESLSTDEAILTRLKGGIDLLNETYSEGDYKPFFVFHRKRLFNKSENCFMAWERKRGKLEEFNRLILGDANTSYYVKHGDVAILPKIRYVITLDEDTLLPNGSAKRLIGAMAHPLNRAVFDEKTGQLIKGYSIIQPRLQVWPIEANYSLFTQVYSGDLSLDLYTLAVSDVYQDLFREGSFVGKGIYDVVAFEKSLENKIPENRLLSHDLFEGIQGRCALASDIVLYEGYPSHYVAYMKRSHRWIRGDWQLVPWLKKRVRGRDGKKYKNTISRINRYKIFDNLRRSLIPFFVMLLLFASWFYLPGPKILWIFLALTPYLPSIFFSFIDSLFGPKESDGPRGDVKINRQAFLRTFFELSFLPHKTFVSLDAIIRTLWRLSFSKKHLLEWVSAAQNEKRYGKKDMASIILKVFFPTQVFSLLVFFVAFFFAPTQIFYLLPFVLLWFFAPFIAIRIGKAQEHKTEKLTENQDRLLRRLSRNTWLFFEHFVGPEDNWLPPDHYQESPRGIVAHRTSPTNIGLLLLSSLSAFDFAYFGHLELYTRLQNCFDGMKGLERYRGHFLNWYDTKSLSPLNPRYVSSVDSGNLAASIMIAAQAPKDVLQKPVIRLAGLLDSLDLLFDFSRSLSLPKKSEDLEKNLLALMKNIQAIDEEDSDFPVQLKKLLVDEPKKLEEGLEKLIHKSRQEIDTNLLQSLSTWVDRCLRHMRNVQLDIERYIPWTFAFADIPEELEAVLSNNEISDLWLRLEKTLVFNPPFEAIPKITVNALIILDDLMPLVKTEIFVSWFENLREKIQESHIASRSLISDFSEFSKTADLLVREMDFSFLFNTQRKVFHIGYNLDSGQMDENYYDLLASEARIASIVAIGKGDVPSSHWLHMARPLTKHAGKQLLLSWSATMFEYLMPLLFMKTYENSLLSQSCTLAVEKQIAYGKEKGTPWGISESSYYHFDASEVYQYRAFGVPGLGYKRGLGEDHVIAPYASILALPIAPKAVLQNLMQLKKKEAWGFYGLIESLDFTKRRLQPGQNFALVKTYMAHHQGMILLALSNYFNNNKHIARFHADPRIKSLEFLLQEQNPKSARVEHPHPQSLGLVHPIKSIIPMESWPIISSLRQPQLNMLTNGNYTLMISASGAGFSRWKGTDLTRWRGDASLDNHGSWIYLKDLDSNKLWSPTAQPMGGNIEKSQVSFYPHKAVFEENLNEVHTKMEVAVFQDADAELRYMELTNANNERRNLSLTSYGEVILTSQEADSRHPAFNKLFIESEYIEDYNALLIKRRPRSKDEKTLYFIHLVQGEKDDFSVHSYETDRSVFLGRGGSIQNPHALQDEEKLTKTLGFSLDPIYALQTKLTLKPYETKKIAFISLVAETKKEALRLASRFQQWYGIEKSREMLSLYAEEEIERFELSIENYQLNAKMLSALLYPSQAMRANAQILRKNKLGQAGLWPFAISGDYPILVLKLSKNGTELLQELLKSHSFWRRRGVKVDFVILNQRISVYEQELSNSIYRLVNQSGNEGMINQRGGIFILREDQMNEDEKLLLYASARLILEGEEGSLEKQLEKFALETMRLPRFVAVKPPYWLKEGGHLISRPENLAFDNGYGGFSSDGRAYSIYLEGYEQTPAPWINVIANKDFGFLVSERGLGTTWALNSGENRLTTWHNDPVLDSPSEALYLRDEDTGQIWSPTPGPKRDGAPYLIRHKPGASIFEHSSYGIVQKLRLFADVEKPIKMVQLQISNKTEETRRITVSYYAEWVLGDLREKHAAYIIPEFDSKHSALLVQNPYNVQFASRVAFLASTRELNWVTSDRLEFLGARKSYEEPSALSRLGLTGNVSPGFDPCAVVQNLIWLAPGETKEVTFLLGQGEDRDNAIELIQEFQDIQNIEKAYRRSIKKWEEILGTIEVKTPEKTMDIMLNTWLLYQSLSCRMWGRTAFYQSSGAYGYRDQLQDSMAFLHSSPDIAREHILRSAASQFEEGDVLHWWHPPTTRGIRSRIVDNLLWLPFVTARYISVTGDMSILDEEIPFLHASLLEENEHERFNVFAHGDESASLYEHCLRAIRKGATKSAKGLPLMGGGDWNDGMNRVGKDGKGESIWMGFFLIACLKNFAEVCLEKNDSEEAEKFKSMAKEYTKAIETHAWDGAWYRRAYFDNGDPLGSSENEECRIDSISQSWAIISGAAEKERAEMAMASLDKELVLNEEKILLLLRPPFNNSKNDPGYIMAYPPGIRENGGQYTHGVLWALWALAKIGKGDRAFELFNMINPINHARQKADAKLYRVEPYVLSADVYGAHPHLGRGGWTWYTGSAAWMYQIGIEQLLGIQRERDELIIEPSIPRHWPGFEIKYRFGKSLYKIEVVQKSNTGKTVKEEERSLSLDGKELEGNSVALVDDKKEHRIKLIIKTVDR